MKELSTFQPLRGTDFYRADEGFRHLLNQLAPKDQRGMLDENLASFSKKVSGPWDALAEETALHYTGPQLEQYDQSGNIVDRVWLPPPVRQLRREVVEAGIFQNGSQLEQFAKVYLLGHLGESSLTCPLACTEGLIRAIEGVGSDFLKKTYLPKLKSVETPLAGAQFVTEQDMGSDVGALTTKAVPEGEGTWRLHGEKWFCSAIDEYFLIAARPEGAPQGTAGVAIFLVPRTIDGKLNNLRIKRLKNKLGTRELPTAEIDLNGALAYHIGPVGDGFKSLMNYVLNTSRIMNAAAACGMMARALLEARNYARQRSAFGRKIIDYPLVQESLNKIESILSTRRAVFFSLVAELDRNPVKDFGSDDAYWQRFLINLCKYRTAIGATECAHEAILLLGGNGTIETFSILPRLYRDSMIIETWEGTHNTLALQICRDGLRFPFKKYFEEAIRKNAEPRLLSEWEETAPLFERLADAEWVGREARRFVDRLGFLLEVAFARIPTSLA
jgi:alkylation response protein AidB-like acyl-CoA dehydrogenase